MIQLVTFILYCFMFSLLLYFIFLYFALAKKVKKIKEEQKETKEALRESIELLAANRIQELEEINLKLTKLSHTDPLTQINNRYKLDQVLMEEISTAKINNTALSIILLDIDNFKYVNDTFGHQAGDEVLKLQTKILETSIREIDIIGRWGGEEFLIICPLLKIEETVILAEELRKATEDFIFPYNRRQTCSFGVTTYKTGDSINSILLRVDQALYQAKHSGKNNVIYKI